MSKGPRLSRLGVLAPAALSVCVDASVLAAPAAGAILSTVLKELSKAFMLKKWFHGVMTASEAENLLMQQGKNGSYLVRESQTHPGEYVLTVRVRGRVSHVMIKREHNKYDVGSGEVFDDLTGLIEHCRAYPLIEASGDVLRLMQPVNGLRASAQPQDIIQVGTMNGIERHRNSGEDLDDSQESMISIGSSAESNRPFDEDKMFEAEFRSLKVVDERTPFTKNEGLRPENGYKNRFRNVIPYDQTRVILPNNLFVPESIFSDYINASYIKNSRLYDEQMKAKNDKENAQLMDVAGALPMETSVFEMGDVHKMPAKNESVYGLVKNKYYIASQGCLWTTMHAFWQMIVHNDVRVIAMLTEGVENGKRKCERYWPEEGEIRRYGKVQVTTLLELEYPYYIIRQFEVMTSDRYHSKLFQYQFKGWPDHDVPLETEAILTYVKDINERMYLISQGNRDARPKENILLVHCSAGIGRTGTLIALDMIIDKLKTEGCDSFVNIHSIVKEHAKLCRYQRAGMVQNSKQYKFLFLAVEDFVEKAKNEDGALEFISEIEDFFGQLYDSHLSRLEASKEDSPRNTDELPDVSLEKIEITLKQLKNG